FGLRKALIISAVLHILTVGLFVLAGVMLKMSYFYWLGILIAAAILVYEHSLVTPSDLSKLDAAFLNMNGILSVLVFLFAVIDIFLGKMISLSW
ncbi:MAG TPA: 4-hydroxybenzoate octaprenyltransferase, partial [Desulfobacteria bacterium]|nr:4-hydroxybenzoate octaprenyltransferase [Desulfobacteria bacterium]